MNGPTCTCPETDPIERATRYTVRSLGDEPHAATCPRRGWPLHPQPTYRVEHQSWCYGVVHERCCNLNEVDLDDCSCGAAEAQAEIDSLADTVRVQRDILDRIEAYVRDRSWGINTAARLMADSVVDIIRTPR